MYKCGYVGVIGKTNAGKSSLVNLLVGAKVSIVTPKTQTTRKNVLGILTKNKTQIVFVDTPGIHKSQNKLDRFMMKNVRSAATSVDVLLYVVDASKRFDSRELESINSYSQNGELPTLLLVSKVDLVSKKALFEFLGNFSALNCVKAIIPYSSKSGQNTDIILEEIEKHLPQSEEKNFLFDEDLYTDSSVRNMSAEIVREKALLALEDELPHGLAIEVIKFDESGEVVYIDMDLICERSGHKSIILGKQGSKIKEIGTKARKDIEELLGKKVMLKIFVKVNENWRQNKITVV